MSVLSFQGVTRRYGDVVALNRVDLDLEPGIMALVGPNASGKSTFMRIATGHSRPNTGTVTAFGEPVWDNPNVTRRLGFVPEQDAFYEYMSGLEFTASLARLHGFGVSESYALAEEELEHLGLGEGMHRPIKSYSKGMRQRAKLAQALVHSPDLLLLDEPLLGCDPIARRRIADRIRSLRNEGCTILVSTHILPEVERLTKEVAILYGGRLVATGAINEVRAALQDAPSRVRLFTQAPRKVAATIAAWTDVDGVTVRSESVDVETARLLSFMDKVQNHTHANWKLQGWETMDSDLDSLFGYVTAGGGA